MTHAKPFDDQSPFQGVLEFLADDGGTYRAVAADLRPGNRKAVIWEIYRQRADRQFFRVGSVRSTARRPLTVWRAWRRSMRSYP